MFHFPNKGVDDVVKISGIRSLTVFTVCLWMSSSNSQGTLFSYAVSGEGRDNELVIDYNRYLRLLIDNEVRYTRYNKDTMLLILENRNSILQLVVQPLRVTQI